MKWSDSLPKQVRLDVTVSVRMLQNYGVGLKFPHSSKVFNTKVNLRELRVQSMGDKYRVFYSFDKKRTAIVLIGGRKGDKRFYDELIRKSEEILSRYLKRRNEDEV